MEEAARVKGVSYHTVSRAARSGKLAVRRSGRMNLISSADLDAWQPMRSRAPKKYRQRKPQPLTTPAIVDLASGERIELARRLTLIYEAIHACAMHQPLEIFFPQLAEQFAKAMYFERVALWVISEDRSEMEHVASFGQWYHPDQQPEERIAFPYDPEHMYVSRPDVYDGITCWTTPPPINTGPAFSAPLVVGDVHLGYIIGDRNGAALNLNDAQIQLGQNLAIQAAVTIDLKRTRHREAQRNKQLEAVLEQISEPVMVYGKDRRITEMSRVARRMYGLPEDLDLSARPFYLRDLDQGSVRFRGHRPQNPPSALALAGQVVKEYEFSFVRNDTGEERLLLVDAVPIIADDQVHTVVAVERDITDQRAAEETEREYRERLERALERTRAIANVAMSLNAGADLHSVLREAGRRLTHLMGGAVGGIGLLIEGGVVRGMWTFGPDTYPDEIESFDLQDYAGTLRAFEAGKPTLNTYETATPRERQVMDSAGTRSNLITPLIVDGELVGATYVNYHDLNPQLSDELIEFNTALASQCVLAIRQARLHDELEQERTALQRMLNRLEGLVGDLHVSRASGLADLTDTETRIQETLRDISDTSGRSPRS
jgi:excisionase family DNA binding protein